MSLKRVWMVGCLLLAVMLAACNGEDEVAPVAIANAVQRVEVGTAVSLDGAGRSDPEGRPLSFAWTITAAPAGSTTGLSNPSAATASFTPDVEGSYVIALVVNDGKLDSMPATVTVVASLSAQARADLSLARAAALKAILTASTGTIRLEWLDTFPEGATYRVEVEDGSGAFSEVETVAGFGVPSLGLRSREIPGSATAFRVQAVLPGRTVPLQSNAASTRVVNRFTSDVIPQILIDRSEPIGSDTRFSVGSTRAFDQVTWSLNGVPIGTGGAGVGNPVTRDFAKEASGTHRVAARVAVSSELSIDVQRDVSVSNTLPLVDIADGQVQASSASGIASVSLSVGGVTVGTLTAPNACSPGPRSDLRCGTTFSSQSPRFDRYDFGFDGSTLSSGDYLLVYTVTDRSGQRVQRTSPLTVSKPPTITLESPPDGALAHGTVRLRGSFIPDLAGTVGVTASLTTLYPSRNPAQALSFRPISSLTGTSVDRDVDLSGIPPGTYSLSVIARNRGGTAELKRTLVVTSTAALRYDPVFVGKGFGLASFVAEGDVVAYRDQNDQVLISNLATGATRDVGILRTALVVSGGSLYSSVWMPGCSNVFGDVCLFQWSLSGAITPLDAGYSAPYFQLLARGSTVGWKATSGTRSSVKLYDAERGSLTTVTAPEGWSIPSSGPGFDFFRRQGQTDVFYEAEQQLSDRPGPGEIYRWSSTTGESRRITTPGMFSRSVMTDGARVAWWQSAAQPASSDSPAALLSQPVEGGPAVTLSSAVMHAVLRDGILAWLEATPTGTAIKASTSGSLRTIATSTDDPSDVFNRPGPGNEGSTWLFATSSGVVVYRQDRRFLAWNALTNQTRVVMDTADVGAVQVSGGFVFFTVGRSLYRVPLGG